MKSENIKIVQQEKLRIANSYCYEIQGVIFEAFDAKDKTQLLNLYNKPHTFGGIDFSFLDLVIVDAVINGRVINEKLIDRYVELGLRSDFLDQKKVVDIKLDPDLKQLTEFSKKLYKFLEKEKIINRHDFDDLKKDIIQQGFVADEKDVELMKVLKDKINETYSFEESQDRNGRYKFNKLVRDCFNEIYYLFMGKVPNETRTNPLQASSSELSPRSATKFLEQQQHSLG